MLRLRAWLVYVVTVLLGHGVLVGATSARELVVALNHAPPYRIVEATPNGPSYSGIYIDVVREAARRAGVELGFEVVPFKRALYLLEHGVADLMLGPNRTDERQEYMYYFDAALPNEPKAIYIGERYPDVHVVRDLNNKTVGVLRGTNYAWQLDEARDVHLVEAADYGTLFKMLDLHRINALIVPELQAIEQIKQGGPYRIRKSDLILPGQPSFIALSRGSGYFTDGSFARFEQVLVEMRHDGTFEQIYNRYAKPVQ